MKMIYVATFCEGEIEVFSTGYNENEADAYCSGFHAGAGEYGAGSVHAYVLPRDIKAIGVDRGDKAIAEVQRQYAAAVKRIESGLPVRE